MGCEHHDLRGEGTPPTRGTSSLRRAFTLIELLVVVGLIGVLSAAWIGGLGARGKAPALQSAQALFFNLLFSARTTAMANGKSSRVLVQMDATSPIQPARYLSHLVLQIQSPAGWQVLTEMSLPEGVFVVPGNFAALPAGLFAEPAESGWTRLDGSALRSTALRENQLVAEAVHAGVTEQWVSINLAPNGNTVQSGDIILAIGQLRSPVSYRFGESPVTLTHAAMVRGVALSSYGVPALINDRSGF
jgi:prepilin-type N-terminal cleavage/methylation domain-containing protein